MKLAASILCLPFLCVLIFPVCATLGINMGVFAIILLCVAALFECSALSLVYGKAYLWCEERDSDWSRLGGCLACTLVAAGVLVVLLLCAQVWTWEPSSTSPSASGG